MRIGFDLRPFLREETGVGTYFKNLLFHLAKIDVSNEYFLFSSSWKDRFPGEKIPPFSKVRFRDVRIPVKLQNFAWHNLGWPPLDSFFKTRLDLTHSPIPLLLPTRGKKVITVHDLFFMDFPEKANREAGRDFLRGTPRSLEKADGILTFSHFMKNEIAARFVHVVHKVRVVPHGLNRKFSEDISAAELRQAAQKYSLPSVFLLFVGTLEPRKNLVRLIDALKIIQVQHREIPLVLVGPQGQDFRMIKDRVKKHSLERLVKFAGYLDEDELKKVYRLASVFVFPSLCEGFGLPLIEAMASGLPVAASMASALPEVGRDAALYFRPEDTEDMAGKIVTLLENKALRQEMIARGKKRALDFSWEKAAAETLDFYERVLQGDRQ